jgi:hypothetical protein
MCILILFSFPEFGLLKFSSGAISGLNNNNDMKFMSLCQFEFRALEDLHLTMICGFSSLENLFY